MTNAQRLEEALLACAVEQALGKPDGTDAAVPEGFRAALGRRMAAQRRRDSLRRGALRTLRSLCAAVAVMSVCFTAALAVSPELRREILHYSLTEETAAVEVSVSPSGQFLDVPEGWTADWYPAWIPDGYTLTETVSPRAGEGTLEYHNGEKWIFFVVGGGAMHFDTDGAMIRQMELDGLLIRQWEAGGTHYAVWRDGARYVALIVCGESEEIMREIIRQTCLLQ